MATDWNSQILFSRHRSRTPMDCPCAIWSRSVENPGRRSRTNNQTNERQTQIIVRLQRGGYAISTAFLTPEILVITSISSYTKRQ